MLMWKTIFEQERDRKSRTCRHNPRTWKRRENTLLVSSLISFDHTRRVSRHSNCCCAACIVVKFSVSFYIFRGFEAIPSVITTKEVHQTMAATAIFPVALFRFHLLYSLAATSCIQCYIFICCGSAISNAPRSSVLRTSDFCDRGTPSSTKHAQYLNHKSFHILCHFSLRHCMLSRPFLHKIYRNEEKINATLRFTSLGVPSKSMGSTIFPSL